MNNKTKIIVSSILVIALCFSMIAGATFALFTSKDTVDISVTSGKVNVQAVVLKDTLATSSFGVAQAAGEFENGGYATIDADSNLILTNVAPGDKATFKIQVTNNSNVDIQYRVKWAVTGELAEYLEATAAGEVLVDHTTDWDFWAIPTKNEEQVKTIDVSVFLPREIGDEAQEKSAVIAFAVEAIQGNAIIDTAASAEQLIYAIENGMNVELVDDIVMDNDTVINVAADTTVSIVMNGKTISGANTKDKGALIVNNGTLDLVGSGTITNTVVNGGAIIENSGDMTISGATIVGAPIGETGYPAYAVYTSGSLTVEEGTSVTSDRGAISMENGANVTINGGTFTVSNAADGRDMTLHTVYAYGYDSTLTVNGGTFELNHNSAGGASVICPAGATISIYDGSFSYAGEAVSQSGVFQNYMGYTKNPVKVYGGTYSDQTVSKWLADGYVVIEDPNAVGTYMVEEAGNKAMTNSKGETIVVPEEVTEILAPTEERTVQQQLTANLLAGKSVYIDTPGTYTVSGINGRTVTVAGTKDVVINKTAVNGMTGSSITLVGVTVQGVNADYIGYHESAAEHYENCTIDSQMFLYGDVVTFKNCTFNQTSANAYNIWTYAADNVTFEGCTFNSAGKALLIYSEGGATGNGEQTVTINNCVFNATSPVAGKAAIEIDATLEKAKVNVIINDCESNGFDKGNVSGDTLYNDKKDCIKAGRVALELDGVAITKSVDAVAAAGKEDNAVITLQAGTYGTLPKFEGENVTLICEEGTVFKGTSNPGTNNVTIVGATFENEKGTAISGTLNGTFKDCVFTGHEAIRWCYVNGADETIVFENCVFNTDFRGVHFDSGSGSVVFKNCYMTGFNAFGGSLTKVTFEGCTFYKGDSAYIGLNLYGDTELKDCKFEYTSENTLSNNFIDMEGTGKTLTITNCTATMDGAAYDLTERIGGSKLAVNTVIIDGVTYEG